MAHSCFLPGISGFKIILNEESKLASESYLWLRIYRRSCTQFIFLLIWSFLLWGVHAEGDLTLSNMIRYPPIWMQSAENSIMLWECTLMQTLYWHSIQDFFCIQTSYVQFHCSLLTIPFYLAEFPNIYISCWLFGSGVGWRATLIGGNLQHRRPKERNKRND